MDSHASLFLLDGSREVDVSIEVNSNALPSLTRVPESETSLVPMPPQRANSTALPLTMNPMQCLVNNKDGSDTVSADDTVAFNSNGQLVAIADYKTVKVFDVETCEQLPFSVDVPDMGSIRCVAWSTDGTWLAIGSARKEKDKGVPGGVFCTVKFVRGSTEHVPQHVQRTDVMPITMRYYPDRTRNKLAIGGSGGKVSIWDVSTSQYSEGFADESTHTMAAHIAWSKYLSDDQDQYQLATVAQDKIACVWTFEVDSSKRKTISLPQSLTSVDWHPSQAQLVTASKSGSIFLVQVGPQLELSHTHTIQESHKEWIRVVRYSSCGNFLASGSDDKTVAITSLATRTTTLRLTGLHDDEVQSLAWRHRPNNNTQLVTVGRHGSAYWIDIPIFEPTVDIKPNENITCNITGDVTNSSSEPDPGQVRSVAWNSDGSILCSGSEDSIVHIAAIKGGDGADKGSLLKSSQGDNKVLCVAFNSCARASSKSAHCNRLIVSSFRGDYIYMISQDHVYSLRDHTFSIHDLSKSNENQIGTIWKLGKKKRKPRWPNGSTETFAHSSQVFCVAWSPDGTRFASGDARGILCVWDVVDEPTKTISKLWWRLETKTKGRKALQIMSLTWNHDGTQLVFVSKGAMYVADVEHQTEPSYTCLDSFPCVHPEEWIDSVAWTSDGERVATASESVVSVLQPRKDGQCKTSWEPRYFITSDGIYFGRNDIPVRGHLSVPRTNTVHSSDQTKYKSVAWSPDSLQLATGTQDGLVSIYTVKLGKDYLQRPVLIWTKSYGTLSKLSAQIRSLAWSPDSQWLGISADNRVLKLDVRAVFMSLMRLLQCALSDPKHADLSKDVAFYAMSYAREHRQLLFRQCSSSTIFHGICRSRADVRQEIWIKYAEASQADQENGYVERLYVPLPDANGQSALEVACEKKDIQGIRFLLSHLDSSSLPSFGRHITDALMLLAKHLPTYVVEMIELLEQDCDESELPVCFPTQRVALVKPGMSHKLQNKFRVRGSDAPDKVPQWEDYEDSTGIYVSLIRLLAFEGIASADVSDLADSPFHVLINKCPEECKYRLFRTKTMEALVRFKWKTFVKKFVQRKLIEDHMHVVFFAFALLFVTQENERHYKWQHAIKMQHEALDKEQPRLFGFSWLSAASMTALTLANLRRFYKELKVYRKHPKAYRKDRWNLLDAMAIVSAFVTIALWMTQSMRMLRCIGAFGVLVNGFSLGQHNRPFGSTGNVIAMLLKVVQGLKGFMIVLAHLLVGYGLSLTICMPKSAAFGYPSIYQSPLHDDSEFFETRDKPWLLTALPQLFTVYYSMLGNFDPSEYKNSEAIIIAASFAFLVVVVMLNLLIAIMQDSYQNVKQHQQVELRQLRAQVIIDIENSLGPRILEKHKEEWFPRFLQVLVHAKVPQASDVRSRVDGIEKQQAATNLELAATNRELAATNNQLRQLLEQQVATNQYLKQLLPKKGMEFVRTRSRGDTM
eukprot:COSAG01_NODE_2551_length_7464_cov_3.080652_1_plen_1470_part_00